MTEGVYKGITEFILNTLNEQEGSLYKIFGEKLKEKYMVATRVKIAMEYMNQTYKALIKNDNTYLVESFNKMSGLNHSKICLIKIVLQLLQGFYESTDFTGADVSSYEEYMIFINYNLVIYLNGMKEKIKTVLGHECKTIDISNCNPNDTLFFAEPIENKTS